MKLPRGTLPRVGLGLLAGAALIAVALEVRILAGRSPVDEARGALEDFSAALVEYRRRHGPLPGDLTRDGEIERVASYLAGVRLIRRGADELVATVAGRPVNLRAIARSASAVPNAPRARNLIELWNLPCRVAQELDAKIDDGNLARGRLRASVDSCAAGGANDPVPVVAWALAQSQE